MNIRILALYIFILISININAQWVDHYSYSGVKCVGAVGSKAVACNSAGVFTYDTEDFSIEKFSTANGYLTSTLISTMMCDGEYAFVGYNDGGIDVLNLVRYKKDNIPEMKISNAVVNKKIRCFYRDGNTLYCGFDEGLLCVNISKAEITTRYKVNGNGIAVNSVLVDDKYIYAATANGIYYADKTSNILEDARKWTLMQVCQSTVCKVFRHGENFLAVEGTVGDTCLVSLVHDVDSATIIRREPRFCDFFDAGGSLGAVSTNAIRFYANDTDSICTSAITSYKINGANVGMDARSAVLFDKSANLILIADVGSNLVISDMQGNASRYLPNGPYCNEVNELMASKYDVYCARGGTNGSVWDNNISARVNAPVMSKYHEGEWSWKVVGNFHAPIRMSIDPISENIYVACYYGGLQVMDADCNAVAAYNNTNSPLTPYSGAPMTMSLAHDANGALALYSIFSTPGLRLLYEGNWYNLSYPYTNNTSVSYNMICTKLGHFWLARRCCETPGLFIFDLNNTYDTDADDLFKSPVEYSNDARYSGSSLLIDDDEGELVADDGVVNVIAEDHDGLIWIGTNDGVLTYDDSQVFRERDMIFSRIKMPRNDGTDLADYLLSGEAVTAIAIDGANRKWFGTYNSGVHLISADGFTSLLTFNESNSPLPSNEINSIAIHPITGEVLIGTRNGIIGYRGDAISPTPDMKEEIKVSPNPVRPDFEGIVNIKGFVDGAFVSITDIRGRLVHRGISNGGLLQWDTRDLDGHKVASGTYYVYASSQDGKVSATGKILIIR